MSDTETPAMPVLALEGVTVRFGGGRRVVTALDAVTFEQRRGSVVGLVGPDGAGKTTLMRVVAGLLPPAAGRIRLLGEDVAAQPEKVTASIGYMPQRFGLYEELSVVENLDLYADLQGVPRGERSERYDALLGMTGLAPFLDRLAGNLSGGMKRKLGLACALIRTPRLLLLDEPTVGVDPVSRRDFYALLERTNLNQLPIDLRHIAGTAALPPMHKDPFDRMLIAQALARDRERVSSETVFDAHGVRRLR